MKMIDKIREQCIDMLEEQYATRMEILVNEELYDDAQAIVQEMVVPEYDINESWSFVDDLTHLDDSDLGDLEWQVTE
jgi:hypothetical protein